MTNKLKKACIKIGRYFFEFNKDLHIQELDNGFLFNLKYYKNLDDLMIDFKESLKEYFNK